MQSDRYHTHQYHGKDTRRHQLDEEDIDGVSPPLIGAIDDGVGSTINRLSLTNFIRH